MKKVFLSVLFVVFALALNAQEKGKIRVGLDFGTAIPNKGLGFDGNLDVRYNIMDNVNVGVKFNGALMIKDVYYDEVAITASVTTSVISSTLITSDYYFNNGTSGFAPFLGGGFGLYKIMNIGLTASGTDIPTPPTNFTGFGPQQKFGGLVRGGFEAGHFRLGLEYYLIPRSNLLDLLNVTTGTSANSFLNFTLGFYLGGGKWKK